MSEIREQGTYAPVASFLSTHPNLTLKDFDAAISHGLDLFSTGVDFDFEHLEANLSAMEKVIPALKRIFKKPLIELKEEDRILPVEAAEAISNKTLSHLSQHPELWDKIEGDTLTPRQLLTRTYQDLYATYENVLVVRYYQKVLSYCRRNLVRLRGMMYARLSLNINLLDRENHRNYYVALEQLQASYIKNYAAFSSRAETDIRLMERMVASLLPYANRPIYRHCKNAKGKFLLRKTNILSMQKDYHRVYVSYRNLFAHHGNDGVYEENQQNEAEYHAFIQCLLLYAAKSYGFVPTDDSLPLLGHFFAFRLAGWTMTMENEGDIFWLRFQKDVSYQIALVPKTKKADRNADAVYTYGEWDEKPDVCLSLDDIDSFRRLERLFLEGMVYSDSVRDICPFCQGKLTYDKKSKTYICPSCHQTIQEKQCSNTGKTYLSTGISHAKWLPYSGEEGEFERDHYLEAMYRYRNINRDTPYGEEICPRCHKVHHD